MMYMCNLLLNYKVCFECEDNFILLSEENACRSVESTKNCVKFNFIYCLECIHNYTKVFKSNSSELKKEFDLSDNEGLVSYFLEHQDDTLSLKSQLVAD